MSMSKQEIFTRVAVHLLRQGRPSLMGDGACAYRGDDGLKCAVGVLIPDELCTPGFMEFNNGSGVMSFDVQDALEKANVVDKYDFNSLLFLRTLQGIHDSTPPEAWQRVLVLVANDHGLSMPRLDDIDALEFATQPIQYAQPQPEGATHE